MNTNPKQHRKSKKLGLLAAFMTSFFHKKEAATQKDIRNLEFSSSSQKVGVTFPEKIRNIFRFRWIHRK